jgi:predicted nuclease with TOPRIM domain
VCSSTAESRAKRAQNDRAKKERVRRKLEAFDELQRERDELLERVEEQETMEEEVFNLQRQIETITSVAEEMICECGGNAKDFHERVAAAFMQP